MELNIFIIILGLCFGSFANACIYRWTVGESVIVGRSYCPSCHKNIAWYDNIPVLSFLFLGGRCRHCNCSIPIRYPVVEIFTAFFFWATFHLYGLTPLSARIAVLGWLFIVSTATDWSNRIIPDEVCLLGLGAGILMAVAGWQNAWSTVIGFFVPSSVILFFACILENFTDKELLGGGDVKFLAGIGAVGGPVFAYIILVFGCVCLAVVFFAMIAEDFLTGRRTQMPMMTGFSFAFVLLFLLRWLPFMMNVRLPSGLG